MSLPQKIKHHLDQINLPQPESHKGQNGKLLIIGGSQLFHAASKWSLDVASKFVDMVFYSSVPENNQLIKEAKGEFWNGIVVPRNELGSYLEEADCILIGPGMERGQETAQLTNDLLRDNPLKKWVIDAGALQMVEPQLLRENHIITPHAKELHSLAEKVELKVDANPGQIQQQLHGLTLLLKGPTDVIYARKEVIEVEGGNAGMTKGGTGDVLAGLVAALYCQHEAITSAVVASYVNKKAGESLYLDSGPFFNTSDLVDEVPRVMWRLIQGKKV